MRRGLYDGSIAVAVPLIIISLFAIFVCADGSNSASNHNICDTFFCGPGNKGNASNHNVCDIFVYFCVCLYVCMCVIYISQVEVDMRGRRQRQCLQS